MLFSMIILSDALLQTNVILQYRMMPLRRVYFKCVYHCWIAGLSIVDRAAAFIESKMSFIAFV